MIPTPDKSIMDKIDKKFFSNLWNNKPHKIAEDVVSNEYQFGGIKMPNVNIKMMHLNAPGWMESRKTQLILVWPTQDLYCYIETKELLKCNLASIFFDAGANSHPSSGWIY